MKRIITLLSILLFAWTLSAQVKLVQVERSSAKWHIPVAKRVIPGAPGFAMTYMELQHLMDSIGLAATADSIYLSNDTIFLRDGSGFVVIPEQTNPDSIYLSNDTIYLRDGSGFVKLPGGGTVNSVGMATGTGGTDINVTGSPITTSGTFTLNIPNSGPTSRGALTAADYNLFNNKPGGSGSANKVAFWSGSNTLNFNNNFHWDNINGRLGIGTTSPGGLLGLYSPDATQTLEFNRTGLWHQSEITNYYDSFTNKGLRLGGNAIYGQTTMPNVLTINNFNNNSGGRIGIETDDPQSRLHVTVPYFSNSEDGIRMDNGSVSVRQQINNDGDLIFRTTSGHMTIGKLTSSIQTSDPAASIHLYGNVGSGSDPFIRVEKNGFGSHVVWNHQYTDFENTGSIFSDSDYDFITLNTFRNRIGIGIGATVPSNTLDLNGTLRVRTYTGTPTRLIGADANGVQGTFTGSTGQVIKFNGTNWTAAADNVDDADSSPSNELITAVTSMGLSAGGNTIVITEAGTSRTGVIPPMTGATAGAAGIQGVVPAPAAGNQNKFLRGDGTWQDAGGSLSGSTGYLPFFNSATTLGTSSVSYRSDAIFGIGFGLAPASITSDIHLGTGKQLEFDGTATIIDKNNSGGGADEILTRAATGGGLDWRGLGLINGQSLLNGDITINSGITGTGSAGRVAFWTGVSTQSNSNNLFWDNSASRLGIGTLTPSRALDNAGASRFRGAIYDSGDSPGTTGQVLTSNGAGAWTWNTPFQNQEVILDNESSYSTTVTGAKTMTYDFLVLNTGTFNVNLENGTVEVTVTGNYDLSFNGYFGSSASNNEPIYFQYSTNGGSTWIDFPDAIQGRISPGSSTTNLYSNYMTSGYFLNANTLLRVRRGHTASTTFYHRSSYFKVKLIR